MDQSNNVGPLDLDLFLKIINALPYSIYVSDADGNPVLVNQTFMDSTGIPEEEAHHQNVYDMVESGVYSPAVTPIVLKEKRKVSIKQTLRSGIDTVVTGIPIFNEANEVKFVVTSSHEANLGNLNGNAVKRDVTTDEVIIYRSKAMGEIAHLVEHIAKTDSTVLISGESGVGKDLIARYIHTNSERANESFLHLNCGAIPESLIESELFGYETGAFSGARKSGKKGLIEAADDGTLFLDEIGEMPLHLQVKLLQFLQNKQITKVGGTEPIRVNVRVIAATNKNLEEQVLNGSFRLDLYYRLNVIPINIPSLKERQEDIIPLAEYFLAKYNAKYNKDVPLTHDIETVLLKSEWKGNIRELENFIERLVVIPNFTSSDAVELTRSDSQLSDGKVTVKGILPLNEAIRIVEEKLVKIAYENTESSYKTAQLLQISQSSAHRRIQKYIR